MARTVTAGVVGLAAFGLLTLGVSSIGSEDAWAGGHSTSTSTSDAVTTSVSFHVQLRLQLPRQYAVGWRVSGQADFIHHAAQETVMIPAAGLRALATTFGTRRGVLPGDRPLDMRATWINGQAFFSLPAADDPVSPAPHGGNGTDPGTDADPGTDPGTGADPGTDPGTDDYRLPVTSAEAARVDLDLTQSAVALTYARLLLDDLALPKDQHADGSRRIDGEQASGTRVDLTLSELLKVIPGLSPTMVGDVSMFGNQPLPVTVWIDRSGRLVEVSVEAQGKGSQPSISGTMTFSGYDEPVAIAAPPARTVTAMPAAVEELLDGVNPFDLIPLP